MRSWPVLFPTKVCPWRQTPDQLKAAIRLSEAVPANSCAEDQRGGAGLRFGREGDSIKGGHILVVVEQSQQEDCAYEKQQTDFRYPGIVNPMSIMTILQVNVPNTYKITPNGVIRYFALMKQPLQSLAFGLQSYSIN